MEEIIDLDTLTGGGDSGGNRSVNFGGGLEFLMNDKKRSSSPKSQIDLAELDSLEKELNDLSQDTSHGGGGGGGGGFFNFSTIPEEIHIEEEPRIHLGGATSNTAPNIKTWDGFSKMNMDAMGDDSAPSRSGGSSSSANLSFNEKRRKKRMMIKKIQEWCEKGFIRQNPNFTMDSPFEEVEDEYEACLEEKRKKDSVKLYGWWFTTFVNTVEFVNNKYDPFDINLEGWSEQVSDDIESYEDIFAELHEKYKGGKIAPELSLLLRLGFSAAMVHITNKTLSNATPGFNDVIRQSPELMRLFTNATVETMSKQSPTMGFMNSMMGSGPGGPSAMPAPAPAPNMAYGRPPPPMETQGPKAAAPPIRPGQMNYSPNLGATRPDLNAARPMFQEKGVDLENPVRADVPERTPRGEMSGPSVKPPPGINDILANLKTKNVDIQQQDDSTVSITSLKELQANTTLPKSARRRSGGAGGRGSRNRSENAISLDL